MERKPVTIINGIYGECRCCKQKGIHKDLSTEYYSDGKCEIYGDIFIECFNLFLCSDTRLPSLICKACVKQLKEAYEFKMRVMSLEMEMIKALSKHHSGTDIVFVSGMQHNKELKVGVKQEWSTDDEADAGFTLEEETHKEAVSGRIYDEERLLSRFPRRKLKPLPKRSDLNSLCPGYISRLEELKGQVITASMLQDLQTDRIKTLPRKHNRRKKTEVKILKNLLSVPIKGRVPATPYSEKQAHVHNISTLLENSNLTAFRTKFKNGFPCFYCKKIFEKFHDLREHQKDHPKDNVQETILKRYRLGRPDCLVVYVDVTNLICTICDNQMKNLNELKCHLTKQHKKVFSTDYTDRVVPFQMSDTYPCQVCGFNFETFSAIERHMNTHYRNYVCEMCGAGFITMNRLKVHTYNLHSSHQGSFPCDICKKVFTTHRKFKIHNNFVHKMLKKLQCPRCPAKFLYYYVRQKHLLDIHGEAPVPYKCNVCEKVFKRRYALSIHIKKEHLNQGDFVCELCGYSCFSINELKVHMAKKCHREILKIVSS